MPPTPRAPERLKPSINPTRPSLNRKFGAARSTRFTRATSICGRVAAVVSVAFIDDDCCADSSTGDVSSARSGQLNSDFGGTAPTFLYQHLRPSISRQDHQAGSDWLGALRHSIVRADVAAQQQTNRVITPTMR